MKKQTLICKITILFILLFSLSGCWDQKEIERRAYVIAIGMDKGEKENQIKITYLIANPEFGSQQQGGTSGEPPQEIISFQTDDLTIAKNMANTVIAKEITYDLLRTVIVSEDFAKDKNFIRWMYDTTKDPQIRRDSYFIVTKESANTFIKQNSPQLETRPHQYFDIKIKRGIETGMIPKSDLLKFFRTTEADADLFLAMYASTLTSEQPTRGKEGDQFLAGEFSFEGKTNKTSFAGSAVFKEGKMIGRLNTEETQLSVILNNTLNSSDIITTFPDPFSDKYRLAAKVIKKRDNEIKMDLKHGTPSMSVTVPIKLDIMSNHSMVDYASNKEKRKELKHFLEKRIKNKMDELVQKTQEEFKGEPFGWSLIARKQFLTIPEYEAFNWMKTYPDMKIDISVEVKFVEFGRQGDLPSKEEMRD